MNHRPKPRLLLIAMSYYGFLIAITRISWQFPELANELVHHQKITGDQLLLVIIAVNIGTVAALT